MPEENLEEKILTPKEKAAQAAKELKVKEDRLKEYIASQEGVEFTVIGKGKESIAKDGTRKKIKRSGKPVRVTALKHCGPAGYAYFKDAKFWIDSEEAKELSRNGYVEK